MMVEIGAVSELEARIARRLAIAFWKGERAERMEVALLDAAPKLRPPAHVNQEGAGRPADHLRRQALQRHPRRPGPDRPRDQPLPQGAAPAAQGHARWNARTNPRPRAAAIFARTNGHPARANPTRHGKSNLGALCETNPRTRLRPPMTMRQARPRPRPQIGAQAPRNKLRARSRAVLRPGRRARARRTRAPFQPPAAAGVGGDAAAGAAARGLTARRGAGDLRRSRAPGNAKAPGVAVRGSVGRRTGCPVRRQFGDPSGLRRDRLQLVDVRLHALADQLDHPLLGGHAEVDALLGDGNRLLGGGLDVGQHGLGLGRLLGGDGGLQGLDDLGGVAVLQAQDRLGSLEDDALGLLERRPGWPSAGRTARRGRSWAASAREA